MNRGLRATSASRKLGCQSDTSKASGRSPTVVTKSVKLTNIFGGTYSCGSPNSFATSHVAAKRVAQVASTQDERLNCCCASQASMQASSWLKKSGAPSSDSSLRPYGLPLAGGREQVAVADGVRGGRGRHVAPHAARRANDREEEVLQEPVEQLADELDDEDELD
eukprot:757104-Hanusia_phi.AAC.1